MKFISAAAVDSFKAYYQRITILEYVLLLYEMYLVLLFFVLKIKGRINVSGMLN